MEGILQRVEGASSVESRVIKELGTRYLILLLFVVLLATLRIRRNDLLTDLLFILFSAKKKLHARMVIIVVIWRIALFAVASESFGIANFYNFDALTSLSTVISLSLLRPMCRLRPPLLPTIVEREPALCRRKKERQKERYRRRSCVDVASNFTGVSTLPFNVVLIFHAACETLHGKAPRRGRRKKMSERKRRQAHPREAVAVVSMATRKMRGGGGGGGGGRGRGGERGLLYLSVTAAITTAGAPPSAAPSL